MQLHRGTLKQIGQKSDRGDRLSATDALSLLTDGVDLHWLGELANRRRRRLHGDAAYYNLNAHINPTNICVLRCPLCAFSCDADDSKAFVLSTESVLARADDARRNGCTEIHMVGGVHPAMPYAWYRGLVSALHEAFPAMHLKAWTAQEIYHFAVLEGVTVEAILDDLTAVGLGSLPGGGAEIFAHPIRRRIAPRKIGAETWLAVHRAAHRLGLRSNATMLYGHIESMEHRLDHLLRLRTLQDETGGFQAFVPLAFHAAGTALDQRAEIRKSTAMEDLRMIALSRLILDNFDHVKAYWISLGPATAQLALGYGADDLDGTVRQERIHHDAGSTAPTGLTVEELRRLIAETGHRPVERDSLYRPVVRSSE